MTYQRPGVYAEERLNPSTVGVVPAPASTGALVAGHNRGPETPTRVQSWSAFTSKFGSFSDGADLAHAAFAFFANGGTDLWVVRAAGTGAVAATRTLNDRAGTPVPTLQVDAINPGAWGNDVYVEIADTQDSGYFDLIVYEGGTSQSSVVERWTDLTMDDADDRYVETVVNHLTNGSQYVKVTDLDSPTSAPNDTPAVTTATALASGADGTVSNSDISTAVNLLDTVPGPFNLNLPGTTDASTVSTAVNYGAARGDVFTVCDSVEGDTVAEAVTYKGNLPSNSYGALYYPRVWTSDPSSSDPNALRLQAPGAGIMGLMAAVDREDGPWRAPAGIARGLAGAVALETTLTNADLDTLNSANVNAVKNISGVGIRVMGARTLKTRQADRYVPVRRTLNFIKSSLKSGTEFAIFEPNDERLWSQLRSTCYSFLASIHQSGGLRGASADDAFYVKCDASLNTQAVIDSGQVIVEVGVALLQPAEFIVLRIGQWQGGTSSSSEG